MAQSEITGSPPRTDPDRSDRTALPVDGDWMAQAACRDEDPELFFPIGATGPAVAQVAEAKAVCNRCPVREICLSYALTTGQDAGVWGGLSEEERRALRRGVRRRRT